MGVQKERKSTFLTALEQREKEARSLFARSLFEARSLFGLSSIKIVINYVKKKVEH